VRMTAHHPWELGAAWVRRPGGYTPAHGSPHQALAGSGQGRAVGRLLDASEGRGDYQLGKRFELDPFLIRLSRWTP